MSRFDKAAKEWDSSQTRQSLAYNIADTLHHTIPLHKQMHLLDFGAGTGLLTKHLYPTVAKITALDFSQEMLKQLQINAQEWDGCEIKTVHSDILKYSNDDHFDGIVSSMSMHHIEDLDALFEKFASLLKSGGFIAIADLEKEDGSFHSDGNDGVYHFGFDHELLSETAKQEGFTDIRFEEAHTVEKEGGRSYPLFLLYARKA